MNRMDDRRVSERRASTLTGFRVDRERGTLAPLGQWPTQAQPRGFSITPDGLHAIVAGEVSNRVGVHAIERADGSLREVGGIEVGRNPNWVEIVALDA